MMDEDEARKCDFCDEWIFVGLSMASHIATKHPEVFVDVEKPFVLPTVQKEGECPHGLDDPSWCSICKHGPTQKEKPTVDHYLTAKLDGQCPECDLPIMIGQRLAKMSNDTYIHAACEKALRHKPLF